MTLIIYGLICGGNMWVCNIVAKKIPPLKTNLKHYSGGIKLKSSKEYNLKSLIDESKTNWKMPEWGFPKGRRNYQENDISCALREFEEETGYHRRKYSYHSKYHTF